MIIPGSNILNQALTVIARQSFTYEAFVSRSTNSIGMLNAVYATPVTLTGSVQPVPRNRYESYGLNFQKNYYMVFIAQNSIDTARDVTGDRIIFLTKTFQVESKTDWFGIDGWDALLCVQVQ